MQNLYLDGYAARCKMYIVRIYDPERSLSCLYAKKTYFYHSVDSDVIRVHGHFNSLSSAYVC
jgi:hypothetical protein